MRKIKNTLICVLSFICCLSFVFGLVACAPTVNDGNEGKQTAKLYLITGEYDIEVGSSAQLKIKYDGKETVLYQSANSEVVSVDADGKMTGLKDGKTYVTASVGEQAVTCKVTVSDVEYSVFIEKENANVVVGTDYGIKAELRRNGVKYDGEIEWSLNKEQGATLTTNGNQAMFKPTVKGEYVITATSDKASAKCVIRVISENARRLATPEINITNCDTVSWQAVENAEGYLVSVNGEDWTKITQTSHAFADVSNAMRNGDKVSINVKAVAGDNYDLIDSYITGLVHEHEFGVEELTEATCLISGRAKYTCATCQRNYEVDEYFEEHTFDNNICSKCNSERTAAFLYIYDEKYDCYYVAGVKDSSIPVAYVSGWYDDGTHGKKPVEYIAKTAFVGNASITHLILPDNVKMIYGNACQNMTALQYVYMGGVETIKNYYRGHATVPDYTGMTEEEAAAAKEAYEKEERNIRTGFNQFLNSPSLKTLVINKNLVCDVQAFVLQSGVEHQMTIYTMEDGGKISLAYTNVWNGKTISYDPTDAKCGTWHFAENGYDVEMSTYNHAYRGGICKYCGQQDPKGLVYKYDKTDDCYYLVYSPDAQGEVITVPATFTDGVNGVKPVKYLACIDDKGVFEGNTTVKKIILPESVVSINGDAFVGCSSLEEVVMPGVKTLQQGEANRDSALDEFTNWAGCKNMLVEIGLNSMAGMFKGYNFLDCTSLTTLIVADGFKALNSSKDNFDNGSSVNVIVLGQNKAVLNEDQGEFVPFYYSEEQTDECEMWYYNADGKIVKNHPEHNPDASMVCSNCGKKIPLSKDAQGVTYGYDAGKDCYYVGKNSTLNLAKVIIPATFNNGVNGEKAVKYVANGAFNANTYIAEVYLPESVIVVGSSSFYGCTSLKVMSMPGVKYVSPEAHSPYTDGYENISTGGMNTFLNAPIEMLIVPDGFDVRESQFSTTTGLPRSIRVYSLATNAVPFETDRASNCKIRSDANPLFINVCEEGKSSPIYYYSENMPTDTNYTFWHYVDGVPTVWTEYAKDQTPKDEQGVAYGYDTAKDCYYVANNTKLTTAKITIPAKFNDGTNGEKAVKYVADGAFTGNTNITHVYLNESVVVIGSSAFSSCTSLEFMSMPGVKAVAYEYRYAGYSDRYTNVTPAEGTFADTGLKTLIVPDGFEAQGRQFYSGNADRKNIIRVYSLATTPAEWKTDRATNCILRTGDTVNNAFIDDSATTGKSPVYYYSASEPTDTNYTYWCYNTDGSIKVWTVA